MVDTMEEPSFQIRGWIYGQIVIVVARSYSRMIHVDHIPSPL